MNNATIASKLNNIQMKAWNDVLGFITSGDHFEVKDMTIRTFEDGSDVLVQVETGFVGDENTVAECLFRDVYQFFIGGRGGLYTFDANSNKRYFKYYDLTPAGAAW